MTKGISPAVLSLEGRSALVTGGGTGLGKACATALAAAGASVTICGPDAAVLDAACADLAALDLHDVRAFTADITDETQTAAAVDAASADGVLHIAVANAGVAFPGSLLHITAEHLMGPIGVNVLGTAHTIKHAARRMKDTGGGSIVTISSIASARPAAFMSTYSVSKAALDELTRCPPPSSAASASGSMASAPAGCEPRRWRRQRRPKTSPSSGATRRWRATRRSENWASPTTWPGLSSIPPPTIPTGSRDSCSACCGGS